MRQKLRTIRQHIPPRIKEKYAQQLAENFKSNFSDVHNLNISSYKATREEISPKFVDHFYKKHNTLYYPILHPVIKRGLWFGKDCDIWVKSKHQLMEPKLCLQDMLAPWLLDAVIVPLVGFDHQCHRIGMGSGYYDQSFAFKKHFTTPQLIGVAFDEQQVDAIAINAWDIPMDIIITPTQVFRK